MSLPLCTFHISNNINMSSRCRYRIKLVLISFLSYNFTIGRQSLTFLILKSWKIWEWWWKRWWWWWWWWKWLWRWWHDGGLGLYSYKHHLDKKNWDTAKFWQELMELFTKWIRKGFLLYEEMQMVSHMSKFITDHFWPFFFNSVKKVKYCYMSCRS